MSFPVLVPTNPLTPSDLLLSRNQYTYRSTPNIILNNPADPDNDTYLLEDISFKSAFDRIMEPNPDRDGSMAGSPRSIQTDLVLRGWVKAPNQSKLFDKVSAINAAFNPITTFDGDAAVLNPGFLNLEFNVPTLDTANYASGLIPCFVKVTALDVPVGMFSKFDGLSKRLVLPLRAGDPRRYFITLQSVNRTGNGTLTANNLLATYDAWPTIVIAFGVTAPSGTLTIQRTTPLDTKIISLSGAQLAASNTLTINTGARSVTYAGDVNKIAAVLGTSQFFRVLPAVSNIFTLAGFPADAVTTVQWYRAYA